MSKRVITHKDVEEVLDREITICFTIRGTFQAQFLGRIVARLRNRFKQYVFSPVAPFATFCFSVGDIKKIEQLGDNLVLTIHDSPNKKKKRQKKKSPTNEKSNLTKFLENPKILIGTVDQSLSLN